MNVEQLYHTQKRVLQRLAGQGCVIVVATLSLLGAGPSQAQASADCKAPQVPSVRTPPDLRINGDNLEAALSSIQPQPGSPIRIDYLPRDLSIRLQIQPSAGRLVAINEAQWQLWPDASSPSHVELCAGDFYTRLQILPGVPKPSLTQSYPAPSQAPAPSAYQRPQRFVEVTSAAQGQLQLSPHFQLWQFLPKGAPNRWPQTTLVSMALLEKLELVMQVLEDQGKPASTLHILSGFRSPAHNRKVGGARYSRHQYGDAVDFIVDGNKDGKMDDLNEDGRVDRQDLDWLTDRLERRSIPVSAGGTGSYESSGPAAAFIHLDARGRDQRWQ